MKKFLKTLVLLFLLCVILLALPPVRRQVEQRLYPRKYNDLVEQYAAEYDLDPLLSIPSSAPRAALTRAQLPVSMRAA